MILSNLRYLKCEWLEENVLTIRINNAEENYTFSENIVNDFLQLIPVLQKQTSLAAVILTGSEKFFCTGGDLHAMQHPTEGMFAGTADEITEKYRNGIQRVIEQLYYLPCFTIAAIHGAAVGAGLGLALACDMRYASSSATFAESFTRIGLIAGDGDAWLLPRILGYSKAAELLLTSDFVDAPKAFQMGLVNEVFASEDVLPKASALARRVARNPIDATRAMKRLLQEGLTQIFSESLAQAAKIQGALHKTEAHQERVAGILK